MKTVPYDGAKVYNITWNIPKNMTKATLSAAVFVLCTEGTSKTHCQYDDTKGVTYFGTTIINSIPAGMKVATAICSAFGPLFLAGYFFKDIVFKKKA